MEMVAMKALGAGLACFGMIGAGIGLGMVFGNFFQAVARQPEVADTLRLYLFIGFALTEAIALFAFTLGILILFV
jgi:F-type H+-transporting ATPase subunit c